MAASSTNIKDVIQNFCQILKKHGLHNVSPETFRLAKFDKDEATRPLWLLNYDILRLILIDFRFLAGFAKTEIGEIDTVMLVKSAFGKLGYRCKEFYSLPQSMMNGSRELLIALGWIIAKYDLVHELSNTIETPVFEFLTGGEKEREQKVATEFTRSTMSIDEVLFLTRRRKLNLNSVRQLYNFVATMATKLDTESNDLGLRDCVDEVSLVDLLSYVCPQQKHETLITLLENEKSVIKCYIKWFQWEQMFWKWLHSVVEEKRKEEKSKQEKSKEEKSKDEKRKEEKSKEENRKEENSKEEKSKEEKRKEEKRKEEKSKEEKSKEEKSKARRVESCDHLLDANFDDAGRKGMKQKALDSQTNKTCRYIEDLMQGVDKLNLSTAGPMQTADRDRENMIGPQKSNISVLLLEKLFTIKFTGSAVDSQLNLERPMMYRGALNTAIKELEEIVLLMRKEIEAVELTTKETFTLLAAEVLGDAIHLPMPKR